MIGLSVAHHMAHPLSRDLLHRPLGNLQDTRQHVTPAYPSHTGHPYTPVSKGVLLDFDHPPPQVLCNTQGQGTVRLPGVTIQQAEPLLVVM